MKRSGLLSISKPDLSDASYRKSLRAANSVRHFFCCLLVVNLFFCKILLEFNTIDKMILLGF